MIATVMFATLHGASIESIYMYSSIFSPHFVKLKLHCCLMLQIRSELARSIKPSVQLVRFAYTNVDCPLPSFMHE